MNDLLTDSLLPRREPSVDGDTEDGSLVPIYSELEMEHFFKQVEEIDKEIEKLSKLSTNLQGINEESKAVAKASAMKAIKRRMEKDIDEVLKIAYKTKIKLDEMESDNIVNRQKPGCGAGSAVDRSRTATTISLKKKLKECITDFQFLRETINKEYREVVERRVFTVTGNLPDEETINQLIETGTSEQILQIAILEQGQGQISATIAEIKERHDVVRDLEKKLFELQQIFFDLAVLVDSQGDILDNIETQVLSAADHVQSGTAAMLNAKKIQKNSRKWIVVVIVILLIVVAVVVVAVLKPWNNRS